MFHQRKITLTGWAVITVSHFNVLLKDNNSNNLVFYAQSTILLKEDYTDRSG